MSTYLSVSKNFNPSDFVFSYTLKLELSNRSGFTLETTSLSLLTHSVENLLTKIVGYEVITSGIGDNYVGLELPDGSLIKTEVNQEYECLADFIRGFDKLLGFLAYESLERKAKEYTVTQKLSYAPN